MFLRHISMAVRWIKIHKLTRESSSLSTKGIGSSREYRFIKAQNTIKRDMKLIEEWRITE